MSTVWDLSRGAHERIGRPLEGKADVDERGQRLDAGVVLRMVEKVPLAALICRMPLEDVELRLA
jgi:hypothetical protein